MDRRAALALVRTPPLRPELRLPALRLPPFPRPGLRALAIAGAVLGAALALYAVARESSLFAVRTIEVSGASPEVAAEARAALEGVDGRSLVALNAGDLERRLEHVPAVRSATVDRSFPYALTVHITPERAAAVYRDGARAWLLAASGRVLAAIEPDVRPRLPRIRLPLSVRPEPGEVLDVAAARTALAVLAELPRRFPVRVLYAEVDTGGRVTVVVEDGLELRLGRPTLARRKLASASAVLRTLSPDERTELGYLDLTVPERVVAGQEVST